MPPTPTAILLFSRHAGAEARTKRWRGNRTQDEAIARNLIAHTKQVAAATGIPVLVSTSATQKGSTFGERFANAIEGAFELGYSQIITLGTDTPEINTAAILEVATHLQAGTIVTGPATDGGIYTLGISRADWNRDAFLCIAWQTRAVQKNIREWASAGKLMQVQLQVLTDLDSARDFNSWFRFGASISPFGRLLCRILSQLLLATKQVQMLRQQVAGRCNGYRGPPLAGG